MQWKSVPDVVAGSLIEDLRKRLVEQGQSSAVLTVPERHRELCEPLKISDSTGSFLKVMPDLC